MQEGEVGFSSAATVLKNGVVSNLFFTFFLMLFLVSIGMKVGSSIGAIFKRYGMKFVVIGVMIPVLSMLVTMAISKPQTVVFLPVLRHTTENPYSKTTC